MKKATGRGGFLCLVLACAVSVGSRADAPRASWAQRKLESGVRAVMQNGSAKKGVLESLKWARCHGLDTGVNADPLGKVTGFQFSGYLGVNKGNVYAAVAVQHACFFTPRTNLDERNKRPEERGNKLMCRRFFSPEVGLARNKIPPAGVTAGLLFNCNDTPAQSLGGYTLNVNGGGMSLNVGVSDDLFDLPFRSDAHKPLNQHYPQTLDQAETEYEVARKEATEAAKALVEMLTNRPSHMQNLADLMFNDVLLSNIELWRENREDIESLVRDINFVRDEAKLLEGLPAGARALSNLAASHKEQALKPAALAAGKAYATSIMGDMWHAFQNSAIVAKLPPRFTFEDGEPKLILPDTRRDAGVELPSSGLDSTLRLIRHLKNPRMKSHGIPLSRHPEVAIPLVRQYIESRRKMFTAQHAMTFMAERSLLDLRGVSPPPAPGPLKIFSGCFGVSGDPQLLKHAAKAAIETVKATSLFGANFMNGVPKPFPAEAVRKVLEQLKSAFTSEGGGKRKYDMSGSLSYNYSLKDLKETLQRPVAFGVAVEDVSPLGAVVAELIEGRDDEGTFELDPANLGEEAKALVTASPGQLKRLCEGDPHGAGPAPAHGVIP